MAQIGDSPIVITVTQADIDNAVVSTDYYTSLGVAIVRQMSNVTQAGFNIASTKMGLVGVGIGAVYDLDLVSISFCNLERLGIKVTVPYTATITLAEGIV